MRKILFLFVLSASSAFANTAQEKIKNELMGQILQTSQEHFVKVHSISIETLSNPTINSFYRGRIKYTTLENEQAPDCYSNTVVFNKLGNINSNAPISMTACLSLPLPVPTESL
jgi:hypothetical protein